MAKRFNKGDMVSGTKWDGTPFIGIYELTYDCGEHCIFDGERYFSIHENDCHHASQTEKEQISKTIAKVKKPTIGHSKHNEEELEKELTEEI